MILVSIQVKLLRLPPTAAFLELGVGFCRGLRSFLSFGFGFRRGLLSFLGIGVGFHCGLLFFVLAPHSGSLLTFQFLR